MRASIVGTTVLAALAAALVLPTGTAWADGDSKAPKIVSVSAPSVVGLTTKGAVFNIDVKVTDNIEVGRVLIGIIDSAGTFPKPVGFEAVLVKGMSWEGTFRAKVTMPASVPLGGWKVRAFATDTAGNKSTGVSEVHDTFTVKYATRIAKLNAGPEPVAKGKTLTVTGKLQQTVKGAWAAYAGKTVKVQFRKKGTTRWITVGAPTSAVNGAFTLSTKATAAGDWRAIYAGNATRAKSTSAADKVALAS